MPRRAQYQRAVDDGSQSITAYHRTGPGGRRPVTGEAVGITGTGELNSHSFVPRNVFVGVKMMPINAQCS